MIPLNAYCGTSLSTLASLQIVSSTIFVPIANR